MQLVKSVVHPLPERMVWWEKYPEDLIRPDVRPVFNPVLRKIGLPEIDKAEQLISGDLLILPSIPALDPMDPLPADTYYAGAIIRKPSAQAKLPDWISRLDTSRPVIYVTVGGAAGHGGSYPFFHLLAAAFKKTDWQVVVSTGGKIDPEVVAGISKDNIRVEQWVPNIEMINASSIVVFHGGYTRMEIMQRGIPSVVIPFHSEQEYYGRIMEHAGVSKVIPFSNEPYERHISYWKGGNLFRKSKPFSVHVRTNMTLSPELLSSTVKYCLFDQAIKANVQKIKSELEKFSGCGKVIELIESKLSIH